MTVRDVWLLSKQSKLLYFCFRSKLFNYGNVNQYLDIKTSLSQHERSTYINITYLVVHVYSLTYST